MFSQKGLAEIVGIISIALILIVGFIFYQVNQPSIFPLPKDQKACTLEAKLCPDGTSVGRTGPNCEFAPCPTIATSSANTANWKTYTNVNVYSFKYPSEWSVQPAPMNCLTLIQPDGSATGWITICKYYNDNSATAENPDLNSLDNPEITISQRTVTIDGHTTTLSEFKLPSGSGIRASIYDVKIPLIQSDGTFKKLNYNYEISFYSNNSQISDYDRNLLNQILSTFKFLD